MQDARRGATFHSILLSTPYRCDKMQQMNLIFGGILPALLFLGGGEGQPKPWMANPGNLKRDESLDCECGIPREGLQGRIVGGENAQPYEYPWVVRVKILNSKGYSKRCGASIINDRVILTAAHCISSSELESDPSKGYDTVDPNDTHELYLHSHFLKDDKEEVKIWGTKILVHPNWVDGKRSEGPASVDYDIALYILDKPLDFTLKDSDGQPMSRPLCLPKQGKKVELEEKQAMLVGWGVINHDPSNRKFASVLQKLEVTVPLRSSCEEKVNSKKLFKAAICTTMNYNKTAVQGDSGSPMFLREDLKRNKYTQVGVCSSSEKGSWSRTKPSEGGKPSETEHFSFYAARYADVQDEEILPYIDYHSNQAGAKYCKV